MGCKNKHESLKSPLAAARGAGSTGEGSHHWIVQRFSAVAMLPIVVWFMFNIAALSTSSYVAFIDWMSSPLVSAATILFVIMSFWHGALGLQTIIEDYIHCKICKPLFIFLTYFASFAFALTCIVSVLKISFGS